MIFKFSVVKGDKMGDSKSVITLQLGHYANYVGAHFWNIQEAGFVFNNVSKEELDVNHRVLFREGTTSSGNSTFTPRLVAVDLKGALGSLPVYGDLYCDGVIKPTLDAQTLWDGEVDVSKADENKNDYLKFLDEEEGGDESKEPQLEPEKAEHPRKSRARAKELYNLDTQVHVWSDFLRARFHPRTNIVVDQYQHQDVTANPFDVYGLGYNSDSSLLDGIEDGIRFFAEECDYLRGFHLLLDSDSAFGGLGVKVSEMLGEDYSSKNVIGFPVNQSLPDVTDEMRSSGLVPAAHCLNLFLNSALTLNGLSEVCSLITPMSVLKDTFPLLKTGIDHVRGFTNINYKGQFPYHSSALLAANLDALSMPWRSYKNSSTEIHDVTKNIAVNGRKLASTAVSLTLPMAEEDGYFVDLLEGLENDGKLINSLTTSLTPGSHDVISEIDSQSVSVRGIDPRINLKPKRDMRSNVPPYTGRYCSCDDVGMSLFMHHEGKVRAGSFFAARSPLPTSCPFPQVFNGQNLGRTGFLSKNNVNGCVDSIPVVSLWQSSEKGIGQALNSYYQRASKINLHKLPKFIEAGLEQDELLQNVDDLGSQADCYKKSNELL